MHVDELTQKSCKPCEGGVDRMSPQVVADHLNAVPQWGLAEDGMKIRRTWNRKTFAKCVEFMNKVADLAEKENHHPDLHLTGYRHVTVEVRTHAVGGLTENDFILAAKIDQID